MTLSTFGRGLDLNLTVVINCEYRMNHRAESRATERDSALSPAGRRLLLIDRRTHADASRYPTARLLELITRHPAGIPSILDNAGDPNRRLAVIIAEGRRVSVTIAAAIIIVVCARFTSDRSPRAHRNLSPSLPLSLSPSIRKIEKLMTANHRRDLSIPIHRAAEIGDSVTHLRWFSGFGGAFTTLVFAESIPRSSQASVTLLGREHRGSTPRRRG